ncbi:carbohydrate-binding protein [Citrobacter braakii]|uniref:gp53-like domain-containing protein n=1 Tax=Citrobacter braakii TaxID=57706 RepID=UPI0039B392F6
MSKIARYQGNVRAFASDAQGMERTVFGGTNQADDLTSQITASFLRGWGIVGASEHPSLEDFNAAMYAMSQFIAYQHQMGVPEWHAEQEYHIGSICTHNGESYQSLQNANIGSQPPSAKWTPVLTSKNGLANLGLGELALAGTMTGVFESAGYLRIPAIIGGAKRTLIVQWGLASGTTGKIATTYATTFPNAVLQVICSVADKSTGSGAVTLAVNQADVTSLASRTTVTITPSSSDFQGTTTARFISIGY